MGEKKQSLIIIGKKEIRVDALLDSGANTSYIDVSLAKKLGLQSFKNHKEKVFLGDGSSVYGYKVIFEVKIQNRVKPIKAIAINVPEQLVIGHDFMQDNDVIIDYVNEKIKFSKRIPLKNRRLRL